MVTLFLEIKAVISEAFYIIVKDIVLTGSVVTCYVRSNKKYCQSFYGVFMFFTIAVGNFNYF